MLNRDWDGIMTKFGHVKKDEQVFTTFAVKHVNEGEVQSFIDSFEKELETNNYSQLFAFPVRWKKLVIDTSDYEKNNLRVQFDEVNFEATLTEISVTHKVKNGSDVFEYVLTFIKEVESEDTVSVVTYLNNKEENDEGKKVFVEYSVNLALSEEQETKSTDFNAF